MHIFKTYFKLLLGVGSLEEEYNITPLNIIITAFIVGTLFLGMIFLLIAGTYYIIN